MKILVTYLSQTGNTRKIAEAIYGEIAQTKEIKRVEEVQSLKGYNLVFLGFPTHNFGPDKQTEDLLKSLTKDLAKDCNVALFVTHGAPEGGPVVNGWVQKFVDAASSANICGVFDCQGQLSQQVKNAMLNSPRPEIRRWAQADNSQGQPDGARLERARTFAKEIVKKLET